MTNTSDLLSRLLAAGDDVKDTVTFERIGLTIELKALRAHEVNSIRASATYPDPKKKGGKFINEEEVNQQLIEKAIVGPAELFSDEVKKHYGAKGINDVIEGILLVGEIQRLSEKLAELNGVSNKDVEDAKN